MTTKKKIQKIIINMLKKIIVEYQPEKVILFGSYAYGVPEEDSDIDILIIKDTDERPIDRRIRIRKIVSDSNERVAFEPIVLTKKELDRRVKIGDQFIDEILTKGKVLYGS